MCHFSLATLDLSHLDLATAAEVPKRGELLGPKESDRWIPGTENEQLSGAFDRMRIGVAAAAPNPSSDAFIRPATASVHGQSDESLGSTSMSKLDISSARDIENSKLSANGRHLAFERDLSQGPAGDANGSSQVLRCDLETGTIVLASANSTGAPIAGEAQLFDISADGRFVLFDADTTDVVPGLTTRVHRAYVRDLERGTTVLASQNDAGIPLSAPSFNACLSADGRYVFFSSASPELEGFEKIGTYVRDLENGTTQMLSRNFLGEVADANTKLLGISENGRFVVMQTSATNLAFLEDGGVILLDRSNDTIVPLDVTKPNLTIDRVDGKAIASNDGSHVWVQIHYVGSTESTAQFDLVATHYVG